MLGASGISSTFGVDSFGTVTTSASFISISTVGTGSASTVGTESVGMESVGFIAVSVAISMATGSSRTTVGTVGEGSLEVTSFKGGEVTSSFTDADRMRSLCVFSSCACWSNLRLKDIGGLIVLMTGAVVGAGASAVSSPSVCVELST